MKSAGKARSNGLYRHIRTSKEIIRNLLNDSSIIIRRTAQPSCQTVRRFVSTCQKKALVKRFVLCYYRGGNAHTQIFPSLQPLCLLPQVRRFLFYCCTWDPASSATAASANVCMALL